MTNRIYVGNLPYSFADADLQRVFAPYGTVKFSQVIIDRMTGQSRGFGFVEMGTPEETKAAIAGLDGADCEGRPLRVNEAREKEAMGGPRPPRPAGGFGGPRPAFGGGPPPGGSGGFGPPRAPGGGRGRGGPPKKRDDRFDKRDKFNRDERSGRGRRYDDE